MSGLLKLLYKFRWYVLVAVLAIISVSVFLGFDLKNQVADLIVQKQEAERPAEIAITRITTSECSQCQQVMQLLERNLAQLNIVFTNEKSVSFGSQEAQNLIEEFQIEKVPTLILNGEVDKTDQLKQVLASAGEKIKGSVVVSGLLPPYVEVATGKVAGEFKVTYLTDKNCQQCYDVDVHKNILASLGMLPFEEIRVDRESQEGKQLIAKYKIAKAPTILLQGDLEPYTRFRQIWKDVGKLTSDNTYVFEALSQMGTYRDLAQDKIIEANQQQNEQEVHRHVNFLVFLEGERFDFAKEPNRYFVKDQRVHLEESPLKGAAGKVIHVHDAGINLRDFLGTLNWQLSKTCITTDRGENFCNQGAQTIKVFRNGEQDSSFGLQELQDGDQYLITFGSEREEVIQEQINQVPNFTF